jgi:hypothetical protein
MPRTVALDVLDRIRIASPCPVRWDQMEGDDRARHCRHCNLKVYNLSAMSREEATALVTGTEGRLCASFYRRPDGTVLTRDCPVGLAAARARAAGAARRIAAAIALVLGAAVTLGLGRGAATRLRQVEPFATVCRWLNPPSPVLLPPAPGGIVMGRMSSVQPTVR